LGTSTNTDNVLGSASSIPSTAMWVHGSVYNTSVLSHELGHCLGLYHTHHGTVFETGGDPNQCAELVNGSNSTTCGDYISDTPADPNLWNVCRYNGFITDANGQTYNPSSNNYMAYSDYSCWTTFISAQSQRMRDFIANTSILKNAIVPVISGSTPICSGSTKTFSATDWQSSYYWGNSSNLSISGSGSSVTVSPASSSSSGVGWVTVNNGGQVLARLNVYIGKPLSSDYDPYLLMKNQTITWGEANWLQYDNIKPTSYDWVIYDYGWSIVNRIGSNYESVIITAPSKYDGTYVYVRAYNSCGYNSLSLVGHAGAFKSPSSSPYPNPVSDILNIEIDADAAQSLLPVKGASLTFDVRLYDGLGNLLRQQSTKGGSLQFNVSSLPDGIYYLHIYDGVNSSPEMHQILVEH